MTRCHRTTRSSCGCNSSQNKHLITVQTQFELTGSVTNFIDELFSAFCHWRKVDFVQFCCYQADQFLQKLHFIIGFLLWCF